VKLLEERDHLRFFERNKVIKLNCNRVLIERTPVGKLESRPTVTRLS